MFSFDNLNKQICCQSRRLWEFSRKNHTALKFDDPYIRHIFECPAVNLPQAFEKIDNFFYVAYSFINEILEKVQIKPFGLGFPEKHYWRELYSARYLYKSCVLDIEKLYIELVNEAYKKNYIALADDRGDEKEALDNVRYLIEKVPFSMAFSDSYMDCFNAALYRLSSRPTGRMLLKKLVEVLKCGGLIFSITAETDSNYVQLLSSANYAKEMEPIFSGNPYNNVMSSGGDDCKLSLDMENALIPKIYLINNHPWKNGCALLPFFVLLGHELYHVYDSLTGMNRVKLPLREYGMPFGKSPRLKKIYNSAEEYWVINIGPYSESKILVEHGFPERYGHSGQSLY